METYTEFIYRVDSFEKPDLSIGNGKFIPDQRVLEKINESNGFNPFFGDTIVFNLSSNDREKISVIINELYENTPECFCERIGNNTLHMTLHDLNNSPKVDRVIAHVTSNKARLVTILRKHPINFLTIKMKSHYIINMVNTSLVLALCPVNEAEYKKLMYLYYLMDEIKELPYPFTPHITLAYYNRDGFNESSAQKLKELVYKLNKSSIDITLDIKNLVYQRFDSMNDYQNVLYLVTS